MWWLPTAIEHHAVHHVSYGLVSLPNVVHLLIVQHKRKKGGGGGNGLL